MDIYDYSKSERIPKERCVIALGFFDGVHIAHRDLFSIGQKYAREHGLRFGVFTFPAESEIKPGVKRLYTTEERLKIFEELSVDFTVLRDFSSIIDMPPREFVRDFLIGTLNCECAVAGYNYRFGKDAAGDAALLSSLMEENGRKAIIREALTYEGRCICASEIRGLLSSGELKLANTLLGSPYRISGRVIHGRGVGRGLGFPTINTEIAQTRAELKRGVYRTAVPIGGRIYTGLTNIGVCPTFSPRDVHAETFLLDFDGDVYDENLTVYFLDYLREERRFKDQNELIMQINVDKNKAISENGEITWQELGLK